MAIEISNRTTKILAGVVLLVAAGAAAWFFFLEEFLSEPPPKPAAVAKAAPKQADAGKPAGDAAKAPAAAPKQVDAPKAAAAKPAAKPIPANPDKLIAEVIDASGIKAQFQAFGREAVLKADTGGDGPGVAEIRAINDIFERAYEPGLMTEELAANLKTNLDVERMGRFLELLRQPIVVKMTSAEIRSQSPEALKQGMEELRRNPPSAARAKLIQDLDDVTRTTEVAIEMSSTIARSMVDSMLTELQKGGKNVPKEARQMVGSQLNAMRDQARSQIRSVLQATYRGTSDEELAGYVKLLDTDTGRWGNEVLANAVRPVLSSRGRAVGAEVGKLAMSRRSGSVAKAAAPAAPVAMVEERRPVDIPAAAPAAPVEVPGYRRAPNIRDAYSRYNDVVTATVMRDRAAVAELLNDGKNPNARQKDGFTALMIAASSGDTEIASLLLAKGADPNPRAGRLSALSIAKSRGSAGAGMVQLLERSGAKD